MKKRRELNALVSKSSSSRSSKTKNGNHELLRNDSYSSDGEDFVLPEKDMTPTRKSKSSFCLMCLLTFSIVMVLSCFGIIGSLVWMFMQLKNEVQDLRLQLDKAESVSTQKLQDVLMKEMQINLKLNRLESKEQELHGISIDFVSLQNQVALLQNSTKTTTSSASSLEEEYKGLSKTIADTVNSVVTLKEDVGGLKKFKLESEAAASNLQDRVQSLQLATSKTSPSGDVTIKDIEFLVQNMTGALLGPSNNALLGRLDKLEETVLNLKNLTGLMNSRISFLEVKMSENGTFFKSVAKKMLAPTEEQIKELGTHVTTEDGKVRAKLDGTLTNVKALNGSLTDLMYRITSLETKLVLLAEQRQINNQPSSTSKTSSTPSDPKRKTTTAVVTSVDKDGKGAPTEVAPTIAVESGSSATPSVDVYENGGHTSSSRFDGNN